MQELLFTIFYHILKYKINHGDNGPIAFTSDPEVINRFFYNRRNLEIFGNLRFRTTGLYPVCDDLEYAIIELQIDGWLNFRRRPVEHYLLWLENIDNIEDLIIKDANTAKFIKIASEFLDELAIKDALLPKILITDKIYPD